MPAKAIFLSNGTFTVPAGVTHVTIEAWGAGGTGGYADRGGGRAGGGSGGNYAKTVNYAVNVGQGYVVTVGQGGTGNRDSWFDNINVVYAKGGNNGDNSPAGGEVHAYGGLPNLLGNVGDVVFYGGAGGRGLDVGSGAGGGAGGTIENGSSGSVNVAGAGGQIYYNVSPNFPYGGGDGAAGVGAGNTGLTGNAYGGGGSGGATRDIHIGAQRNGGIGGNGIVVITYSDQPTSSTIYSSCCTIVVGCKIYTDSGLSTLADGGTYHNGTDCFTVDDNGIVSSIGACVPTQHCLAYHTDPMGGVTCTDACNAYDVAASCYQNVILSVSSIGDVKYTDCSGTLQLIPINATGDYTLTDCVMYDSVTTTGLLTPATLTGISYFASSSICGIASTCGC
jgi:hypothetical protein